MIKVIIVDDHALFRAGLRLILSEQDQIEVVGEAASGEEALRLAKQLQPDICLMDLQMPGGMGGIEATRRLLRLVPNCRVIALTMLGDDPFPAQLHEAGAMGYLTKGCPAEELVKALRLVASGRPYVDSSVAQARMLAQWGGGDRQSVQGALRPRVAGGGDDPGRPAHPGHLREPLLEPQDGQHLSGAHLREARGAYRRGSRTARLPSWADQ